MFCAPHAYAILKTTRITSGHHGDGLCSFVFPRGVLYLLIAAGALSKRRYVLVSGGYFHRTTPVFGLMAYNPATNRLTNHDINKWDRFAL